MIISFHETQKQILAKTKSATRRLWKERTARRFREGTEHQAWTSLPYAKGARHFADIRATRDAYQQPLSDITTADAAAEGFPEWTGEEFIQFFISFSGKAKKLTPDSLVWVAEFEVIRIYEN